MTAPPSRRSQPDRVADDRCGVWQPLRPSFDNPLTWSFPVGRIAGITVRVHVLFALFALIMLLRSIAPPGRGESLSLLGFDVTALALVVLFVIVLMHELGHCIACRMAGGDAEEILLWPLGGLAFCRPRHHWRSHLVSALGGPLVNVLFAVVAGVMLGAITGRWIGVAMADPLHPLETIQEHRLNRSMTLLTLYLVHWTNLVILLFNLLPVLPLDGGRVLQACLWPRLGEVAATRATIQVGYLGAILLGVWGAVEGNWILLGLAFLGGVTCALTWHRLRWTESALAQGGAIAEDNLGEARHGVSGLGSPADPAIEADQKPDAAVEPDEIDRILDKIAASGLESLTMRERRVLQQETDRKRGQG